MPSRGLCASVGRTLGVRQPEAHTAEPDAESDAESDAGCRMPSRMPDVESAQRKYDAPLRSSTVPDAHTAPGEVR